MPTGGTFLACFWLESIYNSQDTSCGPFLFTGSTTGLGSKVSNVNRLQAIKHLDKGTLNVYSVSALLLITFSER